MKSIVLALLVASTAAFGQVEVMDLPTRPGVTVRFVYAKAENPVASAVLFQGGAGRTASSSPPRSPTTRGRLPIR